MSSGKDAALGVALLRRNLFQRLLSFAQFRAHLRQRRLRFARLMLELQDFSIESAQFALHAERSGFIRAPAGDHATLIASAVRRDESVLRVVARKLFSG